MDREPNLACRTRVRIRSPLRINYESHDAESRRRARRGCPSEKRHGESPIRGCSGTQLRCASCSTPCRTPMGRSVSKVVEQRARIPTPMQGTLARWPHMDGSSPQVSSHTEFPGGCPDVALPVGRGPFLVKARISWPFEHPRQRYESWGSISLGTFRWPVVVFLTIAFHQDPP